MRQITIYKVPDGPVWNDPVRIELQGQFRGESRALAARIEGRCKGGKHTYEKGMRREQVVIDFLRDLLPPRFGVARGEIIDSKGGVSRQCDMVVYDALHSPMFQRAEASRLFPSECVYAVIELKPRLDKKTLALAVENIRSAKALDRSAIVARHGGHRLYHGPKANPPLFGAVFSAKAGRMGETIVPALIDHHRRLPWQQWLDCVCVLDDTLVYHFRMDPHGRGLPDWLPAPVSRHASIGYYESGEDTLLVFCLFLLWQLSAMELFPPDLLRYAAGLRLRGPRVFCRGGVRRALGRMGRAD